MSSNNCGCGGCGCAVCSPANTIFNTPCTDPGVINVGAGLYVLDSNNCPRRVAPAEGFVIGSFTPAGYQVSITDEPNVNLSTFAVVSGSAVGVLLTRNADGIIRTLLPGAVANLILMTNAGGQFVLQPIPPATIPDPLSVNVANITTLTVGNETITGGLKFTGLVVGTVANTIGLDAGGNVVIGAPAATGVACAMFYESASSPGVGTPNNPTTAGSFLIIGNQLYDSGANLVGITNNTTLKVLVAGKYKIGFFGQVAYTGGKTGTPALNLNINSIVVNTGNARGNITSTTDRTAFIAGEELRDLAVNDVIQLQTDASSGGAPGANLHVYEARITFEKFA